MRAPLNLDWLMRLSCQNDLQARNLPTLFMLQATLFMSCTKGLKGLSSPDVLPGMHACRGIKSLQPCNAEHVAVPVCVTAGLARQHQSGHLGRLWR